MKIVKTGLTYVLLILAVAAVALAFRLPLLGLRPMHHDEANQAVKCGELIDGDRYTYDPDDHHGPTLYFLTVPVAWLTGARSFAATTEATYRIVPAIFGVGVVLLFFLLGNGIGRPAAVVGAVLAAISPAMVFYSRYYIQEMLLVFFTLGLIISGWRYLCNGSVWWAIAAGVSGALMLATKETAVLAIAAMLVALFVTAVWSGSAVQDLGGQAGETNLKRRHLLAAAAAGALVYVAFFSSFFTHLAGVTDSFIAYGTYLKRGSTGGGHYHDWYYYLQILFFSRGERGRVWGEGLILVLALVGIVAAATGKGIGGGSGVFVRFIAVYSVALTAIYSAIPYKTPWCAISFLQGMIMLAGIGVVALMSTARRIAVKVLLALVLAGASVQLGWQSEALNFKYYAEVENPYAYVHTTKDLLNLVKRVEDLAAISPNKKDMLIAVVVSPKSIHDVWPLPWYLRKFSKVKYFWTGEVPKDLNPEVTIAALDMFEPALAIYGEGRGVSVYGLRPEVFLSAVVRPDLWAAFLNRPQKSHGNP